VVEGVDKYFFESGTVSTMSRANVAKHMLDILESKTHLKKGLSIGHQKA
jgi:hypothetical protein